MAARGRHFAVTLAWLLLSAPALAQSEAIPSECGTREQLEQELKARLGPDAPVDSVAVSIQREAESFRLRVQIGAELRELTDPSCQELLRAAVVVAVSILLKDRQEPRGAPPPSAPPPASRGSHPLRLAVSAGAGVQVGTLPDATPLLQLEGLVAGRYLGAALGARYLLPTRNLDELGRGATFDAWSAHATFVLRPAPAWQTRLGFAAQRLRGKGHGSAAPRTDSVWAAGPTLGLGFVALEQKPWWLGLGAEGQLNAVRGTFQIRNYNQQDDRDVHSVPWLSAAAFVQLGWFH